MVGLLLQMPYEGHSKEALTSKVLSVVRTVQDQCLHLPIRSEIKSDWLIPV